MIGIDTLLFGLVAGLIGFKFAMLATATVLLIYAITGRARRRKAARVPAPGRPPGLHVSG